MVHVSVLQLDRWVLELFQGDGSSLRQWVRLKVLKQDDKKDIAESQRGKETQGESMKQNRGAIVAQTHTWIQMSTFVQPS